MTAGPDHAARRRRVTGALEERELGGIVVTGLSNVRYLTGFSGSNGTVVLTAGGAAVLATDGRYDSQARREVPGIGDDVVLVVTRDGGWLPGALAELGDAGDAAPVGIEAAHCTVDRWLELGAELSGTTLVPVTGIVEELRAVKDAAERAVLRRACAVTHAAFAAMWTWLAPGMTEREVAHRLLGEMIDRGADGPAFDFIVAAGPRGAEPHHRPGHDRLIPGELVTIDAGARVDGYHADMTRTVALGAPPAELRRMYASVRDAQAAGMRAALAGRPAAEIDAVCREAITADGYGDAFVHPTGHGVGLDIHEAPILHGRQAARLAPGVVVTVEPGIYVPGTGGVRIEDVVAVTSGAPEPYTTAPADAPGPGTDSGPGAPEPPAPRTPDVAAHELILL